VNIFDVFALFQVMFVDTQIFYQVICVIWAILKGLTRLNLGVVSDWSSLCSEFHSGPLHWWDKGVSAAGNRNVKAALHLRRMGLMDAPRASSTTSPTLGGSSRESPLFANKTGRVEAIYPSRVQASPGTDSPLAKVSHASSKKNTGSPLKKGGWLAKGNTDKLASMRLMLLGQSDDQALAMWDAFASAWDEVVSDLRGSDLISDKEVRCYADNISLFMSMFMSRQGGASSTFHPFCRCQTL
jgi:hypothetical protein